MFTGNCDIVFKDGATSDQVSQFASDLGRNGGEVLHIYNGVVNGFSATIPTHFLTSLQASDLIEYIEPDGIVTTQ
ncbi:hypothetical protein HYPSUDRAFT_845692 [Hypholoma sublateritium FD-334 SS-4]|uniref:Inhibitor I9 domain-containing protein n=1 Tax=Hypholoma sublateritium (strain FD-334 SS-4) TaxID=945553 RepID=A0A0D2KZP0_HYPSF|nr:hypothetical protein HYPSUDRAFT_845692 [Hypholoma sublateritium FD-334 SS-4]